MTRPPAEPAELFRFSTAERWVHRTTSTLMMVAIVTAAFLYLPFLAEIVGRRRLLVTVHEWAGIVLPVPLIGGIFFRSLRADLRRLNRFGPQDKGWAWRAMRYGTRAAGAAGKFNAGQKWYSAMIAGATLVMMGTGLLMWFPHLTSLSWRTGSTFVHDWLALIVGVLVIGHIRMAMKDPESRHGMRTGRVSRNWARREHELWFEEEQRAARSKQEAEDSAGG
ncbi:cytochrome b/b6 domain-containing protein [Streptacidiphilus sp. PAMC 29251]